MTLEHKLIKLKTLGYHVNEIENELHFIRPECIVFYKEASNKFFTQRNLCDYIYDSLVQDWPKERWPLEALEPLTNAEIILYSHEVLYGTTTR